MLPGLQRRRTPDDTVEPSHRSCPHSEKGDLTKGRTPGIGKGKVEGVPQGLFLTLRGLHVTLGDLLLGSAHPASELAGCPMIPRVM